MASTNLIGLLLPATGTLSGQWGGAVNNAISQIVDAAVAGTQTISTDADVTLTVTEGAYNSTGLTATSAQYAIIRWTANGTVTRNITAPAQSKTYVVINDTAGSQSIVIRGAGPTTGVTIPAAGRAIVAWTGSDFESVGGGSAAGSDTQVQFNSAGAFGAAAGLTWDGTTLTSTGFGGPIDGTVGATTPASGAFTTVTATTAIAVDSGGTGSTTLTANNVLLGNGTSALQAVAPGTTGNVLVSNGTTWTSAAPAASGVSQAKATMISMIFGF
jgi:hypothetical protein